MASNFSFTSGMNRYDDRMEQSWTPGIMPDRDECIEQAYFFRTFRERVAQNMPAQEVLSHAHEEILSTTRLPYAIQFLATELKHTGSLASGFQRLLHYFTPFQAYVIGQAEEERQRLVMPLALSILEKEAFYKADKPTVSGLFVYQFETIARNRLGYDEGLFAVSKDPFYGPEWRDYVDFIRRQIGVIEFADLVYVRSQQCLLDQRRNNPNYVPSAPPLFAEKEGKIARASRGRDPLFLFAALQRQLDYPEVPRLKPRDDLSAKMEQLTVKVREMESRLRMLESEARGTFDPSQFGKPELLKGDDE